MCGVTNLSALRYQGQKMRSVLYALDVHTIITASSVQCSSYSADAAGMGYAV